MNKEESELGYEIKSKDQRKSNLETMNKVEYNII